MGQGVRFELERLALEGDELVVSGFWTGVDGMRFVRPTLLSDDRRILATLEHKPWAPSGDARWTAAFPWTGGIAVDAGSLALAVAPRVIVPLGETVTGAPTAAEPTPPPDSARARQPAVAAAPAAPAAAVKAKPAPASKPKPKPKPKPAPAAKPEPVAAAAPTPVPTARPEPVAAAKPTRMPAAKPAPVPTAKPKPAPAAAPTPAPAALPARVAAAAPAPVVAIDERSDDLARALAAAERDRERALAQLAEAVEARKAAARATAKLELGHAEALAAREAAEAALAHAEAERQEAVVQRDEVLIAYRTLQRRLHAERAEADRAAHGRATAEADAKVDVDADAETDPDSDEPLGVRTLPAVRSIRAELQLPPRAPKRRLAAFDRFVVRVIGLAAAGCFLALLISIVRAIS